MKRILLIRHADSSWDIKDKKDFDRSLSQRGKEEAHLMGDRLFNDKIIPDIFYCSSAKRTRDTCKIILIKLKIDLNIIFSLELYSDTYNSIKDIICKAPKQSSFISIVAHNPHIHNIYNSICSNSSPPKREIFKFPTCGAILIENDVDTWKEFNLLTSIIVNFDAPDRENIIYK